MFSVTEPVLPATLTTGAPVALKLMTPVDGLYERSPAALIAALARAVVKYWFVVPSATLSALNEMLAVPLNDTPLMVRAVWSAVAVEALPTTPPDAVIGPDTVPPASGRYAALSAVCVAITGPVMFGKVALIAALIRRRWLSPWLALSDDVGFVSTNPSMYVALSRPIGTPFHACDNTEAVN